MVKRAQQQVDLFADVPFGAQQMGPEATVHDLLRAKGRRGATAYASRTEKQPGRRAPVDVLAGPRGGRIIAVAADVAEAAGASGSEVTELAAGHVYSGWCMLGLPYRKPKGEKENLWRISTDYADITVEAGSRTLDDGSTVWTGVPYGAYARMVLIALQSEALERGNRNIELGNTAYDTLRRLGLPDGGKVADLTLEQLEKLARCKVAFRIGTNLKGLEINERLIEAFEYDTGGGRTFIKRLRLSRAFFESLRRHPVAIDRGAATRIRNSPMALDIYLWLCYRLPALENETKISWTALWKQFGAGIATMRFFKRPFAENLELARSIYPAANFTLTEIGIILRPSAPPRRLKALPTE
jgi:Plasmid encoded RepA protein